MNFEELVQGQLVAYNNRDLEKFCSYYHPEVKITNLFSERLACDGIEKFREIYKNIFHRCPELLCKLKLRIVLENAVIDEEFVTGLSDYPRGLHTAAIYSFRDGLIDRVFFPR